MKNNKYALPLILVILSAILFAACQRKPQGPQETILVRIGDVTISKEEFISRAEYTLRPVYCNSDNYIHRKIVLNSLIAEKLYALEAGAKNELTENEQFQRYLQGRREQSMRKWQYYADFYQKAPVDTAEIQTQYQLAGRRYRIAYYTLQDTSVTRFVGEKLAQGKAFEEVFREFGGLETTIPKREVTWDGSEPESLKEALYAQPLRKNQVIGPVEVEPGVHTVIKVEGWTERIAISEPDQQQRWNDASQRVRTRKAGKAYQAYIAGLMRGKTLQFDGMTFPRVAQVLGDYYLLGDEAKQALMQQRIWNEEDSTRVMPPAAALDDIADLPFMVMGQQIWTVRDFQKLIQRHPLVFRKRRINKGEFAFELRNAIADLVRDLALTEEAYKKGYDKVNLVARNEAMWRDNLLAIYQRGNKLREIGLQGMSGKELYRVIDRELAPYNAELRNKYNDRIEMDTDLFEQIKLTRIDMFVTEKNAPFPIVVPGFPILTTHNRLDYGRKMEKR